MKKLWVLSLIILVSCGHKEISEEKVKPSTEVTASPISQKSNLDILLIGTYKSEYFADRLLLKAKNAQISPIFKRTTEEKHQVFLGPFTSKEEGLAAFKQMKKIVPNLPQPLWMKN